MGLISSLYNSSVGKKSIMAASGLLLLFFLVMHLFGNAFTFAGRDAFTAYAEKLHSLGLTIHLFEALLLAIFLIHIITGIILFIENLRARPSRYAVNTSEGGRSWGSRTMPYTGVIILIFLAVHLKNFHFASSNLPIADLVRNVLSNAGLVSFYILSLIAMALHLSHGAWSLFQTIGFNHEKYNRLLLGGALAFSIAVAGTYILIPVLVLVSRSFLL